MKDGSTIHKQQPTLLIDDAMVGQVTESAVCLAGITGWRETLFAVETGTGAPALVLPDGLILGVCVCSATVAAIAKDKPLADLLYAAGITIRDLGDAVTPAAIADACMDLMAQRLAQVQVLAAADQRALARLRQQHMQVQDDYAELESWVWDHLAPKRFLVRDWPATAEVLTLAAGAAPVVQLLPAPVRGFVGVDLHLAQGSPKGRIRMRAIRPIGVAFDGMTADIDLAEGPARWVHAQLPRAGGGAPEDVAIELQFLSDDPDAQIDLSLAPESPFDEFCLRTPTGKLDRPLALRVHRTLPRMPAPPLHDNRLGHPADGVTRLVRPNDLSPAQMLPYFNKFMKRSMRWYPDEPIVESQTHNNVVQVQPSVHRPVVARVGGLNVKDLCQIRGIIQNSRHDTMEIAFAIGAAPADTIHSGENALELIGDWVHLLPGEWGEVWSDLKTPLTGWIDLFLVTAMPNMPFNTNAYALFHGFRLAGPRVGVAIETAAQTRDAAQ